VKTTSITIKLVISARTKRLLLRAVLPAVVLLAIAGIAYAALPHTFAPAELLTAANLNGNFQGLDTRLSALEALQSDTSGTRLTARYQVASTTGADGMQRGTKTFVGWFDSMRSEYCFQTLASDGQMRCEPNDDGGPGPTAVGSVGGQNPYFSDAACTKRIITVPLPNICSTMPSCSGCNPPVPKYFRTFPSGSCAGTVTSLFPVGAQISAASPIYTSTGPTCTTTTAPANTLLYDGSSTTEIAPASFVALTVTTTIQ
jgi:hypothetical protein